MAKEYTYTLTKSGKVLYKSVEANYISKETVDAKVKAETGRDPRLERHLIDCTIRVVGGSPTTQARGRFDRNKRMT